MASHSEAKPKIVIHAAALKHVPLVEANPCEGALTNVVGTRIVADLCAEHGVDGAQRGVLLIGNPVTMLLGLPALAWCLVKGLLRGDWARLAVVIGYAVSLGLWLIAPKPVQFYYHYVMPSLFLLGALALSLSDLRRAGHPRWAWGTLAASTVLFAVFYRILSAAPLEGPMSFTAWTWIAGWR